MKPSLKNRIVAAMLSLTTLSYSAPRKAVLSSSQMENIVTIARKITWVNPALDESKAMQYAVGIFRAAVKYKIDPTILISIAQQETNFREDLPEGKAGEIGICQIRKMWLKNPQFIAEFKRQTIKDLDNPAKSFVFAAWILKNLREANQKGSLPWWSFYNAVRFEPRFKYFLAVNRHIATIKRYELEEDQRDILQVNETDVNEFWRPAPAVVTRPATKIAKPVAKPEITVVHLPKMAPAPAPTQVAIVADNSPTGPSKWIPEALKRIQAQQTQEETQDAKKRGRVSPAIVRAAAELEVSDLLQGIIQD